MEGLVSGSSMLEDVLGYLATTLKVVRSQQGGVEGYDRYQR